MEVSPYYFTSLILFSYVVLFSFSVGVVLLSYPEELFFILDPILPGVVDVKYLFKLFCFYNFDLKKSEPLLFIFESLFKGLDFFFS